MIVKVFHASKEVGFEARHSVDDRGLVKSFSDKDFTLVAEVNVDRKLEGIDALNMAYERTNNIDYNWTENVSVESFIGTTRSTSVGDVLEANGFKFVVANIGFKLI